MSPATIDAVFDLLVEECGAHESMREAFHHLWPECVEFRFGGAFGFGGKVWAPTMRRAAYVTCYREHLTDSVSAAIETANDRLADVTAPRRATGADQ